MEDKEGKNGKRMDGCSLFLLSYIIIRILRITHQNLSDLSLERFFLPIHLIVYFPSFHLFPSSGNKIHMICFLMLSLSRKFFLSSTSKVERDLLTSYSSYI